MYCGIYVYGSKFGIWILNIIAFGYEYNDMDMPSHMVAPLGWTSGKRMTSWGTWWLSDGGHKSQECWWFHISNTHIAMWSCVRSKNPVKIKSPCPTQPSNQAQLGGVYENRSLRKGLFYQKLLNDHVAMAKPGTPCGQNMRNISRTVFVDVCWDVHLYSHLGWLIPFRSLQLLSAGQPTATACVVIMWSFVRRFT